MHHCETTPKNFAKSTKNVHGSIGISYDNNYNTKGDENNFSLSVVNSEEIIGLSQIMPRQSSDESDYHLSNYESNNWYSKFNSIDDIRIQLAYGNNTDNLQEKVLDLNEDTVSDN